MKKRLAWKVFWRHAEAFEFVDGHIIEGVNGRTLDRMRHRLRPRGKPRDLEEVPF